MRMHLIWVPGHLRINSRRPRHPFPTLMAGVNPGPVPVHRALPPSASTRHAVTVTTAVGTRTTPHNRGIDHQEKYCTAESLWSSEQARPWETASALRPGCRRPARLHSRHRTPCEATGECLWSNRQSGPWDKPLRHDRELHDCKKGPSTTISTRDWGTSMITRTMEIGLCTTKEVSTTCMDSNCGNSAVFCTP